MRVRVRIQGRVQGVGFRYATRREAERNGLTGWARNCPDGAVEAEFSGDRATLESMLAWCGHGPALARVDQVDAEWIDDESDYASFTIRT